MARILSIFAVLLVARVTVGIVIGYRDYFPPNFHSTFLSGRQGYFYGPYQFAFWTHIITTPLVMFSATGLLSHRLRRWRPRLHRQLGRVHLLTVFIAVVPSSLFMSFYAQTGAASTGAFICGTLGLAICYAYGWRAALKRRFALHERWMMRAYLLLCSAIMLRVLSGIGTLCQWNALWSYPLFAWISTLAPLCVYEFSRFLSPHLSAFSAIEKNASPLARTENAITNGSINVPLSD